MPDHNPIAFEVRILDERKGVAVHLVEFNSDGVPVENGQTVKLTGGESKVRELGGGNYFRIEAE